MQDPATQSRLAHPQAPHPAINSSSIWGTLCWYITALHLTHQHHTQLTTAVGTAPPAEPMATALPHSTSCAQELPHIPTSDTGLCIAGRHLVPEHTEPATSRYLFFEIHTVIRLQFCCLLLSADGCKAPPAGASPRHTDTTGGSTQKPTLPPRSTGLASVCLVGGRLVLL